MSRTHIILNKGLSVVPLNNSISNVGEEGTHSVAKSKFIKMPVKEINLKSLKGPDELKANKKLDKIALENIIIGDKLDINLIQRGYNFIMRNMKS